MDERAICDADFEDFEVYLSLTYIVLGFDRCSFIQEELQNRDMTFLSGNIDSSSPSLTKRQTPENAFIHS